MSSVAWKRGAMTAWLFDPFSACCTKRPRMRSGSRSVGRKGRPSASRLLMRKDWTSRGSRLKSSLASVDWSSFSPTSCLVGSFPEAFPGQPSSACPSTWTSSFFRMSISGSVSITCLLKRTTPDGRPMTFRRSTTSLSRSTVSFSDMRSSSPPSSFRRFSMVSTEKLHRVCNATSMVSESSPHRMKCQYLFELNASTKMLPAISLRTRLALSNPSVMGRNLGT
mmetsp:Transcript_72416/g.189790  ORF Transcript_72416/g.189790 Transcript_72416/m.189790 type:complete len:223 (-) Transcript_72416:1131-1799(-)